MSVNRITLSATVFGQICQNVWHFYIPDQVQASLPALLVNIRDHWMDRWRSLSVSGVTFFQLQGVKLTGDNQEQVETLLINIFGGGPTEVQCYLGNAMCVQFRTGLAGKRNRGRSYAIGTANVWASNGVYQGVSFNSGPVAAVAALQAQWVTVPQWGAWPVIHGPNDNPTDSRIVVSMQIRTTPGSQRRRLVGVGS